MWLWFNQKRELCTLLWLYEIGVTQYSIRCPLPNQAFKQMCFAQCFSQTSPLLISCVSSYRETLQPWINRCSWVNIQFGWIIEVSGDKPNWFLICTGSSPCFAQVWHWADRFNICPFHSDFIHDYFVYISVLVMADKCIDQLINIYDHFFVALPLSLIPVSDFGKTTATRPSLRSEVFPIVDVSVRSWLSFGRVEAMLLKSLSRLGKSPGRKTLP